VGQASELAAKSSLASVWASRLPGGRRQARQGGAQMARGAESFLADVEELRGRGRREEWRSRVLPECR